MSNPIIALCAAGMFAVGLTACGNGAPSAACARIAAQAGPLATEAHAAEVEAARAGTYSRLQSALSEIAKLKAETERNLKELESCQKTGAP